MYDPLLRSAHALRGLFHRGVVVTEAEKDRAFYDEINHRLQDERRGVSDALFLNAQNWQTIPRLVTLLRKLGIPAAALMDFDVIVDNGKWADVHRMLNLSHADMKTLEEIRQICKANLDALPETEDNRRQYKIKGVNALSGEVKKNCEHFVARLASYGLFIVTVGEVERWLSNLNVEADPKQTWLMRIFSAMGSDANAPTYVKPGEGDVWAFIDDVGRWAEDPQRDGIP